MKNVFKKIGWALSLPFVAFALLCNAGRVCSKARKYKKDPNNVFLEDRLSVLYKAIKKILYIRRVKVVTEGFESLPTKQMLFVANHKSGYDPLVLFIALYESGKLGAMSIIAKQELSKKRYIRAAMELMDGIFLDRDNGRSIYQCYLKETELIKKGNSVMVFPEGTRVRGDTFKQFNPTTLKVAFENYIAISPIAIYGSDNKKVPKGQYKRKIYLSALKPIQPNNFINAQKEQLMQTIENDIIAKYNQIKVKPLEEKDK